MKYIVTNYGGGENYTPSLFDDRRKAYEWFVELVLSNMEERLMIEEDEVTEIMKNISLLSVEEMVDLDCFKNLTKIGNGYVIGEDYDENVIQIFSVF